MHLGQAHSVLLTVEFKLSRDRDREETREPGSGFDEGESVRLAGGDGIEFVES